MRCSLLVAACVAASLSPAQASDTVLHAPTAPMIYDWTGSYAGAVAGAAGGTFQDNQPTNRRPTGDAGGFTGGPVVAVPTIMLAVSVQPTASNHPFRSEFLA
jgi:opacity protein-like surface antigen